MNICYANAEISRKIDEALQLRGWSVRQCCREFNRQYGDKIRDGEMKEMNKDFVQKVRSNNFKVVTKRVIQLSDFLEIFIEQPDSSPKPIFLAETQRLEQEVRLNPALEHGIRDFLKNILVVIGATYSSSRGA